MRRLLLIIGCAAVALGAAAGPAVAAGRVALAARVTACTTGVDPADRAVAFTGSMPATAGSRSMQMRFVLLQRRGATGTFRAVDVPDWGGWEHSGPGRAGFVFTRRIASLLAPAGYRAAVYFRWLDRRGRVQRMLHRTTPACEQPDLRPELAFAGLTAVATPTGAAYTVAVGNDGRSTAAPFTVALAIDGVPAGTLVLGPLAADARSAGTLPAARCRPGSTLTVTVDAGGVVDESDETDNVVQRPCPL
ncbi:hypothetical protein FSW04_09070 [Baekduia soli]|uniref:CARDB domain-containing protein n=1 Tax=Baekduia soli TaxID=496014 RepID=A0A5B8U3S4_9ACTN|nr:CARDB domain-containing protein [Baekduia soli]QEC47709.1 hypothetical protein FSW04_09070 [Baekduia soli]